MFKYSKPIYFISYATIFCILLFTSCVAFKCIHDTMNEPKRTSGTQIRSVKYHEVKANKAKDSYQFEPLRIYFYGDDFNQTMSLNSVYNVERAFEAVRNYIERTFQVRKRRNPFLLERQGCEQKWQFGTNIGKCSKFIDRPEACYARENVFHVIPKRFLDKIEVYDFDNPLPRITNKSGPGLLNANFILFLTGRSSEFCDNKNISSFGTHCRVNPKTNEPLAGIINFCPNYFANKVYPFKHYYHVLLHEMFHILGFTSSQFEKFLPCEKGIYCDVPKNAIQLDANGTARMMFPLVVSNTQKHFNCYKPDFGAPMDMPHTPANGSSDAIYSAHWHPLIMYSSIMTPDFSEFDKLFIDNITLSVFESTGWYKINFSNAENFKFGEGQGCMFALDGSCDDSLQLCDPKQNLTGCDLDHASIGTCTKISPSLPCGIYKPSTVHNCESYENKQFELDYYAYGYKRKCIMQKRTESSHYDPECMPVKCQSKSTFDILYNLTWLPCYHTDTITVDNITLFCPNTTKFCEQTVLPALPQHCPLDRSFFIAVRMYFSEPHFKDLKKYHNFKNFKVTAIRGIADAMNISENYIANASLSVFKKTFLDFIVCPPNTLNHEELNDVLNSVQLFLDRKDYLQILKGPNDMIIASFNIKLDPMDVISFSDHEGFRALLIFPVICAIFLIATGIASLLRLFLIQRHKPKRPTSDESLESNTASLGEIHKPS